MKDLRINIDKLVYLSLNEAEIRRITDALNVLFAYKLVETEPLTVESVREIFSLMRVSPTEMFSKFGTLKKK
jgi:hypothetical protein